MSWSSYDSASATLISLTIKSPSSFLLTHLYQFFGALLGCSKYGSGVFTAYQGDSSMYEVHKFMNLGPNELGYFITQVALSGASFGVTEDDLTAVGKSLNAAFGFRCAPEAEIIPGLGKQLNSMCIADECPLHPNATCDAYETDGKGTSGGGGNDTSGNDGGSDKSGSGKNFVSGILLWGSLVPAGLLMWAA